MTKKILSTLFLLLQISLFGQVNKLSNDATVSVFTCGRGDQLYSTFGHTAIRIKDTVNFVDVVFNYGAFDFRTENFYLKFVKGDLQYFIVATSYDDFVYEYETEKREVVEQTLDLSLEKKQELLELLVNSLNSEERNYTYKFIDRNCTTKVVDKINESIGQPILKKVDDKSISYRQLFYPYFDNYFWYKLGINIIFGSKTDAKAEKLFLPVELMNSLDKATVNGKPLAIKKEILVKGSELKSEFSFLNSIYFVALILLIIVITHKKWIYFSYLFTLGIMGLFFCVVGLYSFHEELLWNYNALLFNPLFIILPFLNGKWFKNVIIISIVMLVIYLAMMLNKPHLPLMIPFMLNNGYILIKLLKDYKKSQKKID
jgi:hypothetical protein